MEITFLHVAEYANTTVDQKLNVMGIFNNISAPSFPAMHPEMYLVAQLTARAPEYGRQFRLDAKLLDEDATQELINFTTTMVVPEGKKGLPVYLNLTLRFLNTVFPTPGTYEFSILVDGDVKGTHPIDLILVEQPQQAL
jgi:hypothetical protein